ncbi:MAG TPA: glycosyltransferase [Acetivibrio clariflavus]|nr:glycosyltransferase [Acetivibrio clariflavus]HPU40792.1 glycosyltransferase [Acetivibrio clariflavus]
MGLVNKEKKVVSAVVYVRNHEKYISEFIEGVAAVLSENFEKYEIIAVNDFSTDRSVEMLKKSASKLEAISFTIVNLSFYHGTEAAITAGVDISIGDFVFEFDSPIADYDFKEIIDVYKHSQEGFDIVSAAPDVKERWDSRAFYSLFKRYSQNRLRLWTERFRVLSRRAVNRINNSYTSIQYRKAVYYNIGLKTYIHKYKPNKNIDHERKLDTRLRLSQALNYLMIFTDIVPKISIFMAIMMLLFSICVFCYTVFVYIAYDRVVEGWTTIMLFLSVCFTGFFSLFAIVIKFVSLILKLQNSKYTYTFESVEKVK